MKSTEEEMEARLRSARLAGPSPELRRRVTAAAEQAWHATSAEADVIPWPWPVPRLAACVAGLALLAAAGHWVNDRALDRWQQATVPPADSEVHYVLAESEAPMLQQYEKLRRVARATPDAENAGALLRARHDRIGELLRDSWGGAEASAEFRLPGRQGKVLPDRQMPWSHGSC